MSHREIFYYDSRSNLTCVRDDDLGLTYYTYDAGNRMTSVKNPFGEVAYYEHTPGGRMTRRILGNGCVTYYSYDAIGRVSKVDSRKSDLSVISSFEYERDPVGNPVSILREDASVAYYEYDAKHQLTRETQRDSQAQDLYAWEWDYDPAGNRSYQIFNGVTTYYEYNEANELTEETTDGVTTYYSYDRCGNTTAKQEPDGTTYYHWDYENLLRRIDLPDGAHNYFTYDADAKRVSKQDSEGYTEFIYQGPDMLKLLMERDEEGATQAHYTMGNGLESMRREAESSFYHYDALGSTFELTNAVENVTDTYLYNAWGEVLERTGSTVNPHTYIGNERYYLTVDPALYLLGLRHYVAKVGRFWTLDPARDGVDWYVYASNSPSLRIDRQGLKDIMLTFDDGPHRASLRDIIVTLKRHKPKPIKAGFFVVGKNVKMWPAGVKMMGDHGHRVGNHTQNHKQRKLNPPAWCDLTADRKACEWYWCHVNVHKATGWHMSLYRTPGLDGYLNCKKATEDSINDAEYFLKRLEGWSVRYRRAEVAGTSTGDDGWDHQRILDYCEGRSRDARKWNDAKTSLDWALKQPNPILILHEMTKPVGTAQVLEYVIRYIERKHTIVDFRP